MIEGYCRTNLDDYHQEVWPKYFQAKPQIGERVAAKSGRSLYIVCITHRYSQFTSNESVLEIELHYRIN